MMPSAMAAAAVLAATLLLSGCTALGTVDALTSHRGYVEHAGLAYGAAARQQLDVYVPTSASAVPGGWPVLVFFYGGNWRSGDKADYRFVAQALAARGVMVVVPDYRLYPEVMYPGVLQDSAAAVAWTLQHAAGYGGNAGRVLVAGHSAGAYNAAMVALDGRWLAQVGRSPRQLAGLIGLAGPYDFLPIESSDVQPVFDWPRTPADSQPVFHVHAGSVLPPTLLIAPVHDKVVDPQRNSESLARTLTAAGGQVTLHRYASLNHALTVAAFAWPLRGLAPVLDEVAAFIQAAPAVSAGRQAQALPADSAALHRPAF